MGLKGSPSKSSSTSGSAQSWAIPIATQGANDILNVFHQQQPNLDALQGNLNQQMQGLGARGAALGRQGDAFGRTAGQGNAFLGNVIGGQFMSGNPYIRDMLKTLDEGIVNNVGSGFETGGRYGSGAYVGELAKQLGNANTNVLYGNYSDEMNRRMAATGQAQQALAQQQQAQNANSQQQLAATQLASQIPYEGMNSMGNALGALFNGGTSQSTGEKKGLLDFMAQAASSAATAYAAGSDRRLKKDIVKVGELEDGLNVYEWTYRNDPDGQRCRGVMADEVKQLRPWAYVENYRDGYAGVNYGAL